MFIIKILQKYGYTQGHNVRLSQMTRTILEKTGKEQFKVLSCKKGRMAIESRVAAIGDMSKILKFSKYSDDEFVKKMARGEPFL
ncbi:MAG: hypothetical protein ABIE03_04405 [Patescibacteria group bacterium]|nr:hypothetical protein [Patescibacteria group bacterium]